MGLHCLYSYMYSRCNIYFIKRTKDVQETCIKLCLSSNPNSNTNIFLHRRKFFCKHVPMLLTNSAESCNGFIGKVWVESISQL